MRLIVGMTGATGAPLGVALLQALREMPEVETHLVMSKWAKTTIELETPYTAQDVAALADVVHSPADQAATISSGSFRTDGMIVIPCSMKTLAGIRAGYAEGLVGRAADVVLRGVSWCWCPVKRRSAPFIWRTCWRSPAWAWRWCRPCLRTTTTRKPPMTLPSIL